jgi:hypothetical protein
MVRHLQLIPVEHDPFASNPLAGEFNGLHASIEASARKLSEIAAKVEALGAISQRFDAPLAIKHLEHRGSCLKRRGWFAYK